VSLTGGQGVNLVPDLVGRTIWSFKETGTSRPRSSVRQIRGEPDLPATGAADVRLGRELERRRSLPLFQAHSTASSSS
jgi:hypothetical protein